MSSACQELTTTTRYHCVPEFPHQIISTCLLHIWFQENGATQKIFPKEYWWHFSLRSLPILPITLSKHLTIQPTGSYATDAVSCFTRCIFFSRQIKELHLSIICCTAPHLILFHFYFLKIAGANVIYLWLLNSSSGSAGGAVEISNGDLSGVPLNPQLDSLLLTFLISASAVCTSSSWFRGNSMEHWLYMIPFLMDTAPPGFPLFHWSFWSCFDCAAVEQSEGRLMVTWRICEATVQRH